MSYTKHNFSEGDLLYAYQLNEMEDQISRSVEKESGKGLSTNDFTDELKQKLDNLNNQIYSLTDSDKQDIAADVLASLGDNTLPSTLPSYWKTYCDNKKAKIDSLDFALGRHGVSFYFVSDIHWSHNYKKSPEIINYLNSITTNDRITIMGGDTVVGHGSKSDKLNDIIGWKEATRGMKVVNLLGNHDFNTSDQPSSTWETNRITEDELYRFQHGSDENFVNFVENEDVETVQAKKYKENYGYMDNESQKARFIFLDSNAVHIPNWSDRNLAISSVQIAWLKDRIIELKAGWSVLIFIHIAYGGSGYYNIGNQLKTALDSIYDSVNATIVGVFCGHCHTSNSIKTEKGYVFVATTTDARNGEVESENLPATAGTTTEQCFDGYFVNLKTGVIKILRLGAGDTAKDRQITFNVKNGSGGSTEPEEQQDSGDDPIDVVDEEGWSAINFTWGKGGIMSLGVSSGSSNSTCSMVNPVPSTSKKLEFKIRNEYVNDYRFQALIFKNGTYKEYTATENLKSITVDGGETTGAAGYAFAISRVDGSVINKDLANSVVVYREVSSEDIPTAGWTDWNNINYTWGAGGIKSWGASSGSSNSTCSMIVPLPSASSYPMQFKIADEYKEDYRFQGIMKGASHSYTEYPKDNPITELEIDANNVYQFAISRIDGSVIDKNIANTIVLYREYK